MHMVKDLGLIYLNKNSKRKRRYAIYECKKCKKHITIRKDMLATTNFICLSCSRKETSTKHGGSKDLLYSVLRNMKNRCNNKNDKSFKYYGQKGIKVSSEWSSYTDFKKWALSNGYSKGLVIDRINNNDNYKPENCRWITREENTIHSANRNNYVSNKNIKLSHQDIIEIKNIYSKGKHIKSEIAKIFNVSKAHITRLTKEGVTNGS